jgi:AcrR family transcriptional regulator
VLTSDDEDLRSRFRRAAVDLFQEHGFDRTSAAQIAHAVGVTERTFYRYYSDKRDVLFEGEALVRSLLVAAIVNAPHDLRPLDVVLRALRLFQSVLDVFRPFAKARHGLIRATPSLQERETVRTAGLIDLLTTALINRGTPPRTARLAAQAGMAAFVLAARSWLEDDSLELSICIDEAFSELRTLLSKLP